MNSSDFSLQIQARQTLCDNDDDLTTFSRQQKPRAIKKKTRGDLLITLYERPALERLDHEIDIGRQRVVAVRLAAFRATEIEVTVEPEAELAVARADAQTLVVALDEILVVARPVVYLEVGRKTEQERFASAVEVVRYLQGARC